MFNILLNRYHPVSEDIALTFVKLGHRVTLSVNVSIKDHYGDWSKILLELKSKYTEFEIIPVQQAAILLQKNKYDLVGVDGVFDSDEILMNICRNKNIPFFAINGYPLNSDEQSDNILSLGWFLPTIQYIQKYPSEGHIKQIDWKNIFEKGRSDGKNICIFYPNFWKWKEKIDSDPLTYCYSRDKNYISLIQGYEKWNKFSYEVFQKISQKVKVKNLEGKCSEEVYIEIINSCGLLHGKFADQPGIAVFEAMLLGRPIFTMKSFILASMNQEVLIDGYNAIIADSVDELIESLNAVSHKNLGHNAKIHSWMLTDFMRQKNKLERFIDRCLNVNS